MTRSKRNRKRPRGGIGCLVGDGGEGRDRDDVSLPLSSSLLRTQVVPLSVAFNMICRDGISSTASSGIIDTERRIRIIYPYPFTFATFAKARWIGRTVVDIYHEEFGSYPRSYYEAAIKAGRILVSGNKVDCDYKIKGGDELTHTVHRHEPAVGLSNTSSEDPIRIVYEDDSLLVVDKPATLPIHPCGGYNFNSLLEILAHWKPDSFGTGKLFTIHRLDRLTSGLVLIAKSSTLAQTLGNCIMQRDGCEKAYLARVNGKFSIGLQSKHNHSWAFVPTQQEGEAGDGEYPSKRQKNTMAPCQYGEMQESERKFWKCGLLSTLNGDEIKGTQSNAALGFWMTDGSGAVAPQALLRNFMNQCEDVSVEDIINRAIGLVMIDEDNDSSMGENRSLLWLNFACPCRIASHKNGVCEAGDFADLVDPVDRKGIKPAQTSFVLLSYDALSDTSLVLCKPVTGRTHQIRLHLQKLGHPIANDHCYGGQLWFGDEEGKKVCDESREWLDRLDGGSGINRDNNTRLTPDNSTNADTPATDAEIYHAAADRPREDDETFLDFIEKTCVWCERCRPKSDNCIDNMRSKCQDETAVYRRTLMEYLVRSQGIWLHALQYTLTTQDETGQNKILRYRTALPSWAS